MKRDPLVYLKHMRDSAVTVDSYVKSQTYDHFSQDPWDQAAAIRNLEIIGEAARNVPNEIREKQTQIPWQEIIDFRNVAIHDYMEVDPRIVWEIMQNDIPPLIKQLETVVKESCLMKNGTERGEAKVIIRD